MRLAFQPPLPPYVCHHDGTVDLVWRTHNSPPGLQLHHAHMQPDFPYSWKDYLPGASNARHAHIVRAVCLECHHILYTGTP